MFRYFEPEKTVQAAAILLKAVSPRRMSHLRLLKLLYLADRESVRETGFPITGDRVVAMRNGPVLSRTYDCVKGEDIAATLWHSVCRRSGNWDVELAKDPGVSNLSVRDIETLQRVAEEHRLKDDWELVEYTHTLPEWIKNKPEPQASREISERDIIEAVGLAEDADAILEESEQHAQMARQLAWAARVVRAERKRSRSRTVQHELSGVAAD